MGWWGWAGRGWGAGTGFLFGETSVLGGRRGRSHSSVRVLVDSSVPLKVVLTVDSYHSHCCSKSLSP